MSDTATLTSGRRPRSVLGGRNLILAAGVATVLPVVTGRPVLAVTALVVPLVLLAVSRRRDAVSVLTVFVVLLFAVKSNYVVGAVGASGTPANLVGVVALWWWAHARVVPGLVPARGMQPIRVAVYLLAAACTASFVAFNLRGFDATEASAINRGGLMLMGWAGVALLAADGIHAIDRVHALVRRLVTAATALASVGMLQFFTNVDVAAALQIPGLTPNGAIAASFMERSTFRRITGTAAHPIEFSVVLALVFPLAVHLAMTADPRRRRIARLQAVAIAAAIPMSVSRSGIVGLTAGSAVLFASWTWPQRIKAMKIAAGFAVVMRLLVPGLLGTVKSLFVNLSSDPSTTGRTDDYGVVGHFVKEAPAFGRGFFTFLPDQYTTLDNQYLLTVVELGFVGVTALVMLFFIGVFTARGARRRSSDPRVRSLGQALAGSIVAAMFTFATFDALSFPLVSGVLFLELGCAGALWRLAGVQRDVRPRHVSAI